jgi:hypothetical protein
MDAGHRGALGRSSHWRVFRRDLRLRPGVTKALTETLNESGRLIPAILAGGRSADPPEQGLRTLTRLQQRFLVAMAPHQEQIRHPDPVAALNIAFRSVIATGAHRAAISPWLPDGLTWRQWAREIADMITAYLTAERQNVSSAT